MRAHAPLGADLVSEVLTPEQVSWVRGHHERYDGTGYPDRLRGERIPLGARLLAVADAWDARRAGQGRQAGAAGGPTAGAGGGRHRLTALSASPERCPDRPGSAKSLGMSGDAHTP